MKNSVKILSIMCCLAIATSSFAACSDKGDSSSANSTVSQSDVPAVDGEAWTAENVKLVGRTTLIDNNLWLAMSGSGAEFSFTGKKLDITFVGDTTALSGQPDSYARIAVYVDGQRVCDEQIDEPEKTVTAVDNSESKTVTVKIIKLSECANSTVGVKPLKIADDEKIEPVAAKSHKIEFIGDSITCGYGVDDEDRTHHFSTATEDFTKTYAYKTAENLDADYSIFAESGYGIISGYSSNGKKVSAQALPQYYGSLGNSWNQMAGVSSPQDVEWDFSQFTPEAVVINLGTNDDTYCKDDAKKQEYSDAYVEFIKTIREKYPDAHIFCTLGIMGGNLMSNIELAVFDYQKQTNDENISTFQFDVQNSTENNVAADWHPTEKSHNDAAEALTAEIKKVMGW